jgi:molybdopterin biosynthesis enzyme
LIAAVSQVVNKKEAMEGDATRTKVVVQQRNQVRKSGRGWKKQNKLLSRGLSTLGAAAFGVIWTFQCHP